MSRRVMLVAVLAGLIVGLLAPAAFAHAETFTETLHGVTETISDVVWRERHIQQ